MAAFAPPPLEALDPEEDNKKRRFTPPSLDAIEPASDFTPPPLEAIESVAEKPKGVLERARELSALNPIEFGDSGPVLLRDAPGAITEGTGHTPAITIPKAEIRQEQPTIEKAGKAAYNTVAGFVEGATSAEGLEGLMNPFIGIAQMGVMVPHLIGNLREADKTPANSPERWQAATDVLGFVGLPLVAHGAVKLAKRNSPRTIPETIDEAAPPIDPRPIESRLPVREPEGPALTAPPETIPPIARKTTPMVEAQTLPPEPTTRPRVSAEERHAEMLRRELEEQAEVADEYLERTGDELIDAIRQAGGLPTKGNVYRKQFSGEIDAIESAVRDPQATVRVNPTRIFQSGAPDPQELAASLRDKGFDVPTTDDMFQLINERFRTGRKVYGNEAAGTYASPKQPGELDLLDRETRAKNLVRSFQEEHASSEVPKRGAAESASETGEASVSQNFFQRARERVDYVAQNRKTLADTIAERGTEEEFASQGLSSKQAIKYGQELIADYASGVRGGKLPQQARYPIYRGDFSHRPHQYINAADHALHIVEESMQQHGFTPKEDIYLSPRKPRAVPPIPPPAVPPGQVLTMEGRLPVTMERTAPGTVSGPEVMDSLKRVMTTAGSVGEIRRGRFGQQARGIFKTRSEVVRLEQINDVPTAIHETGHALMKQLYGTVKSRGLRWVPSAVRRELIGMGKELYGDTKPVAGYTAEGFSEFLRHWMTNENARKIAPATHRFFEEGVLIDHPKVATQLKAARTLMDIYRRQGAIERANRQLVREPGWTRRTLKALGDFFTIQRHAESADPLRRLSKEAAQRTGKSLPPSADPYKLFKMKRGSSGPIVERMVNDNMVDAWGNATGPSLKEALAEVKGNRKPFLLYVFGKIAEKRWAEGKNPGIAKEDATYLRSTLETPAFDRAAKKFMEWNHGLLDYVAQADPSLQPLVDKLKQESFYAPLARMLDENQVRKEAAMSQSNPLYQMRGSGLPVKDIFDQTVMNAARLVNRANRALVTNAVVKLANIEGMGRLIEEVPIDKVRQQFNVELIRADLEKMGLDTSRLPQDEILAYYTAAEQPKGADPIVPVRQTDGSTKWFYVDPKIYDVLEKIEPFSLRTISYVGPVLDLVIGAPKRLFTLGTTGLRPAFSLVTNPLRDPQGWLLQTKAGINPAKMAAAYFNALGEQLRSTVGGREGPLSKAAYNLGAHMAQPLGRDIGYTKRATDELFHGRFLRVVKHPIDQVRQLLGVPESLPRLAEFKRVGQEIGWKPGEPMTPDQAVQLSIAYKEASVDFSASGDVSRIVNEAVPFYNPAIQGTRTAARAFRDHPLRTTLVGITSFTGPALVLWWQNKDKEWYRNLPWRERYYYNNIDDGKNVWQIPRPFEWGNLFQVLPEAALDSWYRQDPESLKKAFAHIIQTQNPLGYPVALNVAKEQWRNHIEFWDRPIVPRSEIELTPGAQVGPYTTKFATALGRAFPNDLSPRRIDAALRGFGGGALPDLLDALGLGSKKSTRESELADTPVVGRLWRRGGYYNAQSQHLAEFWDLQQGVAARTAAEKLQLKDPSRPQTMSRSQQDILMAPLLNQTATNISAILKVANQLAESEARRSLYKSAADEAKIVLELWKRQKQNVNSAQN